jgi:hypothetical protein
VTEPISGPCGPDTIQSGQCLQADFVLHIIQNIKEMAHSCKNISFSTFLLHTLGTELSLVAVTLILQGPYKAVSLASMMVKIQ